MDEDFKEQRYPFESAREFFVAHWREPAAAHLDFAWVAALLLIFHVFGQRQSLGRKLLALYFGLTVFNNFAFQVLPGSTLGDVFGVCCALYLGVLAITDRGAALRPSPVGFSLCIAAILMTVHAAAVGAFDWQLNLGPAGFLRLAVIAKVFVFGLAVCLFDQVFVRAEELDWLIRRVIAFACVGLVVYVLQGLLLLSGTVPFGTYIDAGFIGFPSFGSVSIERGHFGKFMTPLYPLFVYLAIKWNRVKTLILFFGVTLINFSASSLSFFAGYTGLMLLLFHYKMRRGRVVVAITTAAVVATVFVAYTWKLWASLVQKIYFFAFQGGQGGGRGVGIFFSYLMNYPYGTSYGGSSLRIAPGLAELNTGIFSFLAQLSFLGLLLIAGFGVLLFRGLRHVRHIPDRDVRGVLIAGILMIPVIFAADILWFVPTIWLPLLLAYRYGAIYSFCAVEQTQPANVVAIQ